MSAQQTLRAAIARLTAAAVPDPARDARLLLAQSLGIPAARLALVLHDPMPPGAAATFETLLTARLARQPVSQILGRRAFWGRDFRVTPDVLDPRPETETLVALALREPFARVLDLGTGSGAILLTLLAERPAATGTGSDLSSAALAVARHNAAALGVDARVELLVADWFDGVQTLPGGRFDLIVSNPPYIAEAEMPALAPEVLQHEPRMALTPGGDGLDAYRAIADGVRDHLRPMGRLMTEIGPTQGAAVAALFAARGLTGIEIAQDLDHRDRVVLARAPG